jgi:hypothetical protein
MNNDSIIEIQKKKLELLEQEKDNAMHLYEQSRQIIIQLEEENNDLKNPLKPHLIKLDMQTKQVNLFYVWKDYLYIYYSNRHRKNMHEQKLNLYKKLI